MQTLKMYKQQSGQLINKEKKNFYLFNKVALSFVQMVGEITGFCKGSFPFNLRGETSILWGEKAVLINHVLQSIPFYLLSAMRPPKCVIDDIHKIFAKFFWDSKEQGRATYWVVWGGIVVSPRREYCKRQRPQLLDLKRGSQVLRDMLQARDFFDKEIWWEPREGHASVWFDNWTQLGALHFFMPISISKEALLVQKEDIKHGGYLVVMVHSMIAKPWNYAEVEKSIYKISPKFGRKVFLL
ncbi:hypothetical protein H5410_021732, partial [Solanum commersonii]